MNIDTPLQIGFLIAFGAFTVAIITAFVWYLLRSKSFTDLTRLNMVFLLLFVSLIAAVMSLMLFIAVADGEAYSYVGGRHSSRINTVHSISQEPALYWIWVVLYYGAAVAALSVGLVVAARLIQPRRSLSDADFMKRTLERVGEEAGASSSGALDAESEIMDPNIKRITQVARTSMILGIAFILVSLLLLHGAYPTMAADWAAQPDRFAIVWGGFMLVGAILMSARTGVVIDRQQCTIATWWGLLVPFYLTRHPISQAHFVTLSRDERTHGRGSTYEVFPVRLESIGTDVITLLEPRDYDKALYFAEDVAKFARLGIRDRVAG